LIKGIVGKISKNDYQGKILTSFALKGQEGWYSLGERSFQYNEGDSIQFNVQTRGKYVYAQDITPWDGAGATQAPSIPTGSGATGSPRPAYGGRKSFGGGKSDEEKQYWAKKDEQAEVTQRRIEIQAARNAAIETASFMFEKELVKVPTKQADKYDAFMELVETITDDYLKKTSIRLSGGNQDKISVGKPEDNLPGTSVEVSEDEGQW
jgi:hypothetical protein